MRARHEVPARLLQLKQRFADWRESRTRGQRIPERLWNSAAKLADEYGLSLAATTLKLDYYGLKKRLDQHVDRSAPNAPFLELPSSPLPATSRECLIELEDGKGASMRVHLKGANIPDVLALGHGFWNAR